MSSHSLLAPGQHAQSHYRDGLLDENIPVRAVNNSDEPIIWQYARVKYTLTPRTPVFIPYLAMCLYQGDPRAIDLPGDNPDLKYRREEYARLRIHCGVYENDSAWATCPHTRVDCFPIDSDVPFNTVLRDPDGINQTAEKADNNQTAFLQTEMERMASQMRAMQAQLAQAQSADAALDRANIDPADLDRQATTSRVITPEEATGQPMVGAHPVQKSQAAKKRPAPGEGPQVTKDA